MNNSQRKSKQIPVEQTFTLRGDDVSRRAASVARMIDRMGSEGVFTIRIEKHPAKWVVNIEQCMTVQILDLTQ